MVCQRRLESEESHTGDTDESGEGEHTQVSSCSQRPETVRGRGVCCAASRVRRVWSVERSSTLQVKYMCTTSARARQLTAIHI